MNRHAKKRDANEPELVHLARLLGAKLHLMHEPSDWLMAHRGQWHLVEIKNPDCQGDRDEYTKAQVKFRIWANYVGAPPIITWRCEADVYRTLGARRAA